jgi:glycosyltransferase involved in cell wall biosynthesis
MKETLLSIVIPTYNRDLLLNSNLYNYQFLIKYINLGKIEVIIIDNDSSDNTSNIVTEFSKNHFEIKSVD